MSPTGLAPELTPDSRGLVRSGDIQITVMEGVLPLFIWLDAVAYGLMVDRSLSGNERTLWEIHSTVGFSPAVPFGQLPPFAELIDGPLPLIRGNHYFVSVYGTYPRYGIQEFVF